MRVDIEMIIGVSATHPTAPALCREHRATYSDCQLTVARFWSMHSQCWACVSTREALWLLDHLGPRSYRLAWGDAAPQGYAAHRRRVITAEASRRAAPPAREAHVGESQRE